MNAFLRHLDRQRYEEEANCDVEIIPAAFIEAAERHIARYNRPLLKTFLRPEQTFYVTGSSRTLMKRRPRRFSTRTLRT